MTVQVRNDQQVALLSADFQLRYEPNFAWGAACALYQALPGLRGFWPMSAFASAGATADLSGQSRGLTYNGNPTYGYDDLIPYIRLDGTGDYLTRGDEAGLDITGAETYVVAGQRGITILGWWRPENTTLFQYLVNKMYSVGQYSYMLSLRGDLFGDPVTFTISDDGNGMDTVSSSVGYAANTWQFLAGRFNDADTGAELAVFVNGTKTTAATARNAIFSGTDNLAIGGTALGGGLYTGRASLVALCATALSDLILTAVYEQTRPLFSV